VAQGIIRSSRFVSGMSRILRREYALQRPFDHEGDPRPLNGPRDGGEVPGFDGPRRGACPRAVGFVELDRYLRS